jgi:hypothetical protein
MLPAVVLLCSRMGMVSAFEWPSSTAASLRAGCLRALCGPAPLGGRRRHAAAPAGVMHRRMLGALPFPASFAAGLGVRASSTAASAEPDEAWSVVRTPGDGSCLFHAVGIAAGAPAAELRAVAADAVYDYADAEFNGASLRQWIQWETGLAPDQYSKRMAAGEWGGQIELFLLARGLDTPIQVRARSMKGTLPFVNFTHCTHSEHPFSRTRWDGAQMGSAVSRKNDTRMLFN